MRRLETILTLLVVGFLGLQVVALGWESTLPVGLPEGVGNHEATRQRIRPAEGDRYSFGVIGDVQGADVGHELTRAALAEDLHFLVFNGDLVRKGRHGYHRILEGWLGSLAPLPAPVFYAMGNRDLKKPEFAVEEWEARYGPSNFHFAVGGDLFLVVRYADPWWPAEESLDFLRTTLARERGRYRRVFVFTHVPPPFTEEVGTHAMLPEHWEVVRALCAQYSVDYWISGHYHGFVQEQVGPTTMIISGGGGGGLHQDGARHHAVILEVSPEEVSIRRLFGEGTANLLPGLRGALVGELFTMLRQRPGVALGGNLALLLAVVLLLRRRRRRAS